MKNSENENEKKSASFFICRIASIIILAVLFVFPFSMREMNLLQPELTSETLYPFKALFSGSKLSSLFLRISLGGGDLRFSGFCNYHSDFNNFNNVFS